MFWFWVFTIWPLSAVDKGAAFVEVEPDELAKIVRGSLHFSHPKFRIVIKPLFGSQLVSFLQEEGFDLALLERPGVKKRLEQIVAFSVEVENLGRVDLHFNPNQVNLLRNDFPYGQRVTPILFYSDPYLENEPELQKLAQFFETGNFTLSEKQKERQILAYHHSKARFKSRDTRLVFREIYFAAEPFAFSGRLTFY